jgi:hypothetical protein
MNASALIMLESALIPLDVPVAPRHLSDDVKRKTHRVWSNLEGFSNG